MRLEHIPQSSNVDGHRCHQQHLMRRGRILESRSRPGRARPPHLFEQMWFPCCLLIFACSAKRLPPCAHHTPWCQNIVGLWFAIGTLHGLTGAFRGLPTVPSACQGISMVFRCFRRPRASAGGEGRYETFQAPSSGYPRLSDGCARLLRGRPGASSGLPRRPKSLAKRCPRLPQLAKGFQDPFEGPFQTAQRSPLCKVFAWSPPPVDVRNRRWSRWTPPGRRARPSRSSRTHSGVLSSACCASRRSSRTWAPGSGGVPGPRWRGLGVGAGKTGC